MHIIDLARPVNMMPSYQYLQISKVTFQCIKVICCSSVLIHLCVEFGN